MLDGAGINSTPRALIPLPKSSNQSQPRPGSPSRSSDRGCPGIAYSRQRTTHGNRLRPCKQRPGRNVPHARLNTSSDATCSTTDLHKYGKRHLLRSWAYLLLALRR